MATTNDDTAWKLTTIKSFPYRGAAEEWSNSYHFDGTIPTDHDAWAAFAHAVATLEKECFYGDCKVVRAYGYAPGSNQSVAQIDFNIDGPVQQGMLQPGAIVANVSGDQAAWVRWLTPEFTSTGKHIYLRKYFHAVFMNSGDSDRPSNNTIIALQGLGDALVAGVGAGSHKIVGPKGAVGGRVAVGPYLTTRTLKRRGKRPPN